MICFHRLSAGRMAVFGWGIRGKGVVGWGGGGGYDGRGRGGRGRLNCRSSKSQM